MFWHNPPTAKIYEALGALADGRVSVTGNSARVYSSSRNKFYIVTYDPDSHAIMVNDNASYFRGYLGYPGIAFLMHIGEISYEKQVANLLKGIPWKDLNRTFKNNFDTTTEYILGGKTPEEQGIIREEVRQIEEQFRSKHYRLLGEKMKPPEGY